MTLSRHFEFCFDFGVAKDKEQPFNTICSENLYTTFIQSTGGIHKEIKSQLPKNKRYPTKNSK